ncbi:hypothetical protein FZC33_00320 [Labrys sp. KNU-23]|uniref:hypothetical protein n=1 Tax=Labrys sp. KNU-23 TaxID=2789216 RepID=UPI0011EE5957|nr:hypothetical protein [Labrys sp. KNU-23]QEN84772.1 hypothetical protein FZC33_00320 [Labrys sp. KNU-23]
MDDSDHSTTLAFVTRRRLLAGTAIATLTWPFQAKAQAAELQAGHDSPDPALLAWQEWKTAALRTEALCHKQQRLETRLVREIGFPQTTLRLPESGKTLTIFSPDTVEDICGSDPGIADLRAKAEAELAAHQARWDAVDERIGYSATKQAEVEAGEREQELVEALTATPATSLAGIAGKLDMIFHEGTIWEDDNEFPQPQIRSALRDLIRIGQVLEPNTFMPGGDREASQARRPNSKA